MAHCVRDLAHRVGVNFQTDRVLDRLQELYGPISIGLELRKLAAPIPGFDGVVAVQRQR